MPDFSTIDNRYLDSGHILISGQFKHSYPLNISCSKIFDSCKIKRMVTNLTQLGYVNIYDQNRYLEKFSKAAVHQLYLEPFAEPWEFKNRHIRLKMEGHTKIAYTERPKQTLVT